ncbi:Bug family tripartite tricarboxylate transporter substrate binding protein [Comamonas sp. J-3]|uniref:Bug family tripartite tricarboxylate transporter substrate binding protein n=1 Tax=Comamonas trifloxystrobinivorans TaxID=3350256 RepID=UPI003727D5A7
MAITIWGSSTWAGEFPDKPLRLVVPFAAGGSTDVTARVIGNAMAQSLGQPVIVENRTGAAGAIGAAAVSKSAADGYTILVGGVGPILVIPELDAKLPYSPEKDLEPIAQVSNNDYGLIVRAESPVRSVKDYVSQARTAPGQLSYTTTGVGGPLHVGMEYFALSNGLRLNHVPYQGESQIVPDLLAGRVDLAVMSLTVAGPLMKSGKVRMLALLNKQRSKLEPDVPTIAEAGFAGHEIPVWLGFFVPKGTPDAVVQKLTQATSRAITEPEVQKRMLDQGAEPTPITRTQYVQFLDSERNRWKKQIAETGIRR